LFFICDNNYLNNNSRDDNTLESVTTLTGHQLGIVSLAKNATGTGK